MGANIFTNGAHQATDIGIVTADSALKQGAINHRFANSVGQGFIRSTADVAANNVMDTFAVAYDIFG